MNMHFIKLSYYFKINFNSSCLRERNREKFSDVSLSSSCIALSGINSSLIKTELSDA